MDKSKIKIAARKALMVAAPDYYSWPAQQQEQFRATMSDAAQRRVEAVLLKNLQGIQCTAEKASEVWRDLPLSKLDNLNWAKLLTTGIGDDTIFLNESMAENKSLLDFNSLYDYDYEDYLFQEQANKKEFKDYKGRDYYALRFSRWARLIVNDQFYYTTLYSLAGYLTDEIEDKSHDCIQKLTPHEYVEGRENGKRVKGGFRWDMQADAGGKEKQLDELKSRWYRYTKQRWLELSKEFVKAEPAVYFEDIKQKGELNRNFIFNNENALKQIRWKHFLADCEPLIAEFSNVTKRAEQEAAKAETFLQEAHEDIMKNFDPKVVKLKKKMKVVVAPGALDGLIKDDTIKDR
ncbi:hypothetical protein MNBD_GAMMA12-3253 [hydrothermal vent metagenome]|uniref:Uncharacterized protein n=1 Tax=hydrothermal vent metagenome TaxID=652676 RepID=A0A3B0YBX1_9ZZZZ